MPTTIEMISQFLNDDRWSESEKEVIKWQYRLNGGFKTALWHVICLADDDNLELLSKGFPLQIAGYLAWTRSDLAKRLQEAGLDI